MAELATPVGDPSRGRNQIVTKGFDVTKLVRTRVFRVFSRVARLANLGGGQVGLTAALLLGCSSVDPDADSAAVRSAALASSTDQARAGQAKDYTLFEAGAVRPIAVLPRGLVAVTNIPDDRVEFFRASAKGLVPCGSVHVGLRPVALAAVGERVWVVNHLSDSVSVIRVDPASCRGIVERTLLVGDEPRDVIAATGAHGERYAFVTAAHRGQNVMSQGGAKRDPELTTPGVGRADVFVFRADRLEGGGGEVDEQPTQVLTLFTDSPRALAVGSGRVYAAGFFSGNQTSVVRFQAVVARGRASLAKLDSDGDLSIDANLPEGERRIEGGYPAIRGHGRCVSGTLATGPGQDRTDFWMDVCVRTDPNDPARALELIRQVPGVVTPTCSCTDATGELQMTPPLIVRMYESPSICGPNYNPMLGGCWLEPPHDEQDLAAIERNARPPNMQAWNDAVAFRLPDQDVFTIDLKGPRPAVTPGGDFRHVGTTLFSMAVHPKTGKLYVGNTEARNHVRFEGPGALVPQGARFANTTVRGHVAESRITVLDPATQSVKPIHLNAHIDYSKCCAEGPNRETEQSLAFPVSLVISNKRTLRGDLADDQDLYVTALGSNKVAVLSTSTLDRAQNGQVVQTQRDHIEVPGGPVGLALDEARDRLYVLARFSNELVVLDTRSRRELERHRLYNPEPPRIVKGRPFLYDARNTSSHGDTACASCHVFGDFDGLAWDLGAPDDRAFANAGPFFAKPEITSAPLTSRFLPVKGPMTTQSLRGMANHGAMHWRGDRRGGLESTVHAQPDTGAFDEQAAFKAFNVAFPGLNGRSRELSSSQLQAFTDFVLALTYPPNPIRNLDDSLTEAQKRARSRYFGCEITDASMARRECADGRNIDEETLGCNCLNPPEFVLGIEPRPDYCPKDPKCTLDVSDFQNTCNGCHSLDPSANARYGVDKPGFFGTRGVYTNDSVSHVLKIPHLRNMYQKVGMFGSVQTKPGVGLNNLADSIFGPRNGGLLAVSNASTGDQVRGFGFTHAGEEDTLFHFFSSGGFARAPSPGVAFPNDNRGGFEAVLPKNPEACFGMQLGSLNQRFLAALGSTEVLARVRENLSVLLNPSSEPSAAALAAQALGEFITQLPPSNPGSVFQRLPVSNAVRSLALPLLACPSIPPYATLAALGCFDLHATPGCAPLLDTVRGCSLWGATLEQLFPNGTLACRAAGLDAKEEMESFMFAFDSNLKPIVGQQVTLSANPSPAARARLELLLGAAARGDADVVAFGKAGALSYAKESFCDADGERLTPASLLRHLNKHAPITVTAVPPASRRN